MKALTIWQPWASLIMAGAKPWEWRGWPAPRNLIGQRIVIHAGARAVKPSEIAEIVQGIRDGDSSLVGEIAQPLLEASHSRSFILACGVGTAILGEPITAAAWVKQYDARGYDSSRVDHHRWGWPLSEIERFEQPIPAKGAQGFWEWTSATPGGRAALSRAMGKGET